MEEGRRPGWIRRTFSSFLLRQHDINLEKLKGRNVGVGGIFGESRSNGWCLGEGRSWIGIVDGYAMGVGGSQTAWLENKVVAVRMYVWG